MPDPAATNSASDPANSRPANDRSDREVDLLTELTTGYRQTGLSPGDPLLLAVSGGLDSMVLLAATVRLWPDASRLTIAHLDHGLRPAGKADRAFVEDIARQWGLPCLAQSLPAGTIHAEQGSVEEAARKIRYRFLQEAATKCGAAVVATAHHRSDQVETLLHNLLRGTGLRGLGGMPTERLLENSVRLVRPLHAISHSTLAAWAERHDIPFREDESNRDPAFTRNRLRREIVPVLREFNPQLEDVLAGLANQARDTVDMLDELSSQILDQQTLERQPQVARFQRPQLAQLSDATRRHLLTTLWTQQGWPRQKMTFSHWQQLSEVLQQTAGRLELPGGICVTTTESMVRFIVGPR